MGERATCLGYSLLVVGGIGPVCVGIDVFAWPQGIKICVPRWGHVQSRLVRGNAGKVTRGRVAFLFKPPQQRTNTHIIWPKRQQRLPKIH